MSSLCTCSPFTSSLHHLLPPLSPPSTSLHLPPPPPPSRPTRLSHYTVLVFPSTAILHPSLTFSAIIPHLLFPCNLPLTSLYLHIPHCPSTLTSLANNLHLSPYLLSLFLSFSLSLSFWCGSCIINTSWISWGCRGEVWEVYDPGDFDPKLSLKDLVIIQCKIWSDGVVCKKDCPHTTNSWNLSPCCPQNSTSYAHDSCCHCCVHMCARTFEELFSCLSHT